MIDETVEAIEARQTHSSSIVAIEATQALSELLERDYATVEEFVRDVERNSDALRRANLSHASLYNAQRTVVESVTDEEFGSVDEAKAALRETIDRVVADVETSKHEAATHTADLLDDGTTVLIHDYSTTVLEAIELAVENGTSLDVYVTEARPRYQGRKTARTLAGIDGVDVTLVIDSAAGHYLSDCDRALVGMVCIVGEMLYNRVGTFPIAAAANEVGVPMTVAGSGAKVIEDGFVFENDDRPGNEVMLEPSEGFAIENPAYDATPTALLDAVITDDGRIDP